MRSKLRSKWRNWQAGWRWSWITSGAVILVIILGYGYLQTRVPAAAEMACRDSYARARTAADSASVDNQIVSRRTGGGWNCGMLRRVGATAPRPH
jgi:hypothetical protein